MGEPPAILAPSAVKVKIVTPRLHATRDFYLGLFGLGSIEEWDEPDDAGCILALSDPPGGGLVEIYKGEEIHDFSGLCLQFKVPDLGKFIRSAPPAVAMEGPVSRPWGSHYLYLTDPAGVPVVVFRGCFLVSAQRIRAGLIPRPRCRASRRRDFELPLKGSGVDLPVERGPADSRPFEDAL